jgi:integrase
MSDDPSDPPLEAKFERERASKPAGVARVRQPLKDRATGLWRARYVDLDGVVRQAGRFERKGDAVAQTATLVAELNRDGVRVASVLTLVGFLEEWPRRFPRHPRTQATNIERIRGYLLPLLPNGGDVALGEIRRADLRAVQDALLRRRLAKSTIDGAFSALSALMRDAMDVELIDANPAARMRVRPADPRLDPKRGPVERRAVPPAEIRAFIAAVAPKHRAACWTPVLSGCRPGELFAMHRTCVDRERELIYLHQTVDRYGHLMDGLKGTHHIADEAKRGRWTLFPRPLLDLLASQPAAVSGFLFPSPRGKFWAIRNFYRNVWTPAQREAGVAFSLYDLRHTFASRLLAAGIPLVEVSAWMGHGLRAGGHEITNTTTRVYAHATGEWRHAALRELSALVEDADPQAGHAT